MELKHETIIITGGTSGISYLRRMLEVVLFPELWGTRTAL